MYSPLVGELYVPGGHYICIVIDIQEGHRASSNELFNDSYYLKCTVIGKSMGLNA